jgi:hypothetical protein
MRIPVRFLPSNLGEYGGSPLDKPFVEGAPIYFPRYVMYYDELFRSNPDRAAACNYDISKSADTLIWDWWCSENSARFRSLRGRWLMENAAWLRDHVDDDFDPYEVLARALGIPVNQLPHSMEQEELEAWLSQ